MSGAHDLETSFGEEFGQNALNNYRGWRSWGQLNESSTTVSSDTCPCCRHVRQSLVPTAVLRRILVWIVDVQQLHHAKAAAKSRDSQSCGFCAIIYQQFWAWQTPTYRLKSQIWAKTLRQINEGDEMVSWTEIRGMWNALDVTASLGNESTPCFQDATGNEARSCNTRSCSICHQDSIANLEFGKLDLLCETCRNVVTRATEGETGAIELRPAIPLLVKPTLVHDGSKLSTLGIKHAAGVPVNNGTAPEWLWTMYTIPGDKAASFVPGFRRATYDHQGVYDQIKRWTAVCGKHEVCNRRRLSIPFLPKRVLDVSDTGCKLRETTGERVAYVALSYCWGAPQPRRLVTSNLEAYQGSIKLVDLPQTIQDAVMVTRNLGFAYLWVDSLCIIQDDDADKLTQLSKMREIYSQSALTICASGPRNCNEGFVGTACFPGTTVRMPDVGVNYPCDLLDGLKGHVRLIERIQYRPQAEALTRRGWTFQEELLPISIVRFGACLTWECDELAVSKTVSSLTGGIDSQVKFSTLFVGAESNQHLMRRTMHDLFASEPAALVATHQTRLDCPANSKNYMDQTPTYMIQTCTCDDGAFFAAWKLVVKEYTKRELTEPSDKLVALGGLAEAFSRVREDRYLAGLWQRRLLHDLMWTADPLSGPRGKQTERRRLCWRAPSWSWACHDVGIDTVGSHGRILSCHLDNCTLIQQSETADIVDCSIELGDPANPFGAVRGGAVTLKGPLRRLPIVKGDYLTMLRVPEIEFQLVSDSFAKISHPNDFASPHLDLATFNNVDLEALGSLEEGIWVYCLQMREEIVKSTRVFPGRAKPEHVVLMDGLVLLPVDRDLRTFCRIGVWVTDYRGVVEEEQHPFRGIEAQQVTLV